MANERYPRLCDGRELISDSGSATTPTLSLRERLTLAHEIVWRRVAARIMEDAQAWNGDPVQSDRRTGEPAVAVIHPQTRGRSAARAGGSGRG